MQVSIAAENLRRIRAIVKRARNESDKVDNEKVNLIISLCSGPYPLKLTVWPLITVRSNSSFVPLCGILVSILFIKKFNK